MSTLTENAGRLEQIRQDTPRNDMNKSYVYIPPTSNHPARFVSYKSYKQIENQMN